MPKDIDEFDVKEYDPNYKEGETDKFADAVLDLLVSLVDKDDLTLTEKFTSKKSLFTHFDYHCVGAINKKSTRTNVRYDFTKVQQYHKYERELNKEFRQPNVAIIDTLYDEKTVIKAFRKLFEGGKYLLFSSLCGFRNQLGKVYIGLNSFANNVTTNYGRANTINVIVLTQTLETITLYPVDASYLETKFNHIIKLYHQDKELNIKFTKDKNLKEGKIMATFEEKRQALANYLECDVEEIEEGYDEDHFEHDGEEYAVYTDEEADKATYDDIENLIDDMGIEAFAPAFQEWIMYNATDTDWFEDAQRESAENYVNDIEDESDGTYENRLIAELVENGILDENNDFHFDEDDEDQDYPLLNDDVDLDSAKDEYIDDMCNEDPVEWYENNFGLGRDFMEMIKKGSGPSLDMDAIVDECNKWDGRGHSLATYDGEEIELENDLYAYRTN